MTKLKGRQLIEGDKVVAEIVPNYIIPKGARIRNNRPRYFIKYPDGTETWNVPEDGWRYAPYVYFDDAVAAARRDYQAHQ